MKRPKIGIIISTTREGRFGEVPARWFHEIASERDDLEFEVVDLRDYPLDHLAEHSPSGDEASRWSEKIDELDGYVFVTAEYNHSISGVLKNALDHLNSEMNLKPATFVGYGGVGGARAVEQLRLILIELQVAPLSKAVHIGTEPLSGVRKGNSRLSDYDFLNERAETALDELSWWTNALKVGRETATERTRSVRGRPF